MPSPSSQLMIAFEGFFVVARSQTFEGPKIQRSGVRQCADVPIGGVISLFRIKRLFKVSTRLDTYQNMLNSFNSSRHNAALAPSRVYRWLCPRFHLTIYDLKINIIKKNSEGY